MRKKNSQNKSTICTILNCTWTALNEELHFEIEANRFLRGMVRGLVATSLSAGRNKISMEEFASIFKSGDNRTADFSAPAQGLFLRSVQYPDGLMTLIA